MLELLGVVVESSVVSGSADVRGLSKLERGEGVHEEEAGELEAILVGAEHILVVEEVGSEEEQKTLEVHDLWVFCSTDEARAGVCVCHYFY